VLKTSALRGKLEEVDEKWLGESISRIKFSYDDERKNRFILKTMKRQTQKLKAI
jgi:hypothetical protein